MCYKVTVLLVLSALYHSHAYLSNTIKQRKVSQALDKFKVVEGIVHIRTSAHFCIQSQVLESILWKNLANPDQMEIVKILGHAVPLQLYKERELVSLLVMHECL